MSHFKDSLLNINLLYLTRSLNVVGDFLKGPPLNGPNGCGQNPPFESMTNKHVSLWWESAAQKLTDRSFWAADRVTSFNGKRSEL